VTSELSDLLDAMGKGRPDTTPHEVSEELNRWEAEGGATPSMEDESC
jgi:hypothetical protein